MNPSIQLAVHVDVGLVEQLDELVSNIPFGKVLGTGGHSTWMHWGGFLPSLNTSGSKIPSSDPGTSTQLMSAVPVSAYLKINW